MGFKWAFVLGVLFFVLATGKASATISYQETANSYSCNSSWVSNDIQGNSFTCNGAFDADWNTWARATNTYCNATFCNASWIFINYTKQDYSVGAKWDFLTFDVGDVNNDTNITIPSDCFSQTPLQLAASSTFGQPPVDGINWTSNWYCKNSTSWKLLTSYYGYFELIYEEGLYWNISQNPINGTTYYNQFIFNNISANSSFFNATSCWIKVNNNPSVYIACAVINSSIIANIGLNNLTFFWNNGTISSETILFNVTVKCDAYTLSSPICGGNGYNYILNCKRFGLNLYQFDYSNMTYCPDGCLNGTCIVSASYCLDRCANGDKVCNNGYTIPCVIQSNGCYDWDYQQNDWIYCKFGRDNGVCLTCVDQCRSNDAKCVGNAVFRCDDGNGDGCFEWSTSNRTDCEYGCYDISTNTTALNATCNYHSFNDMHDVANTIQGAGVVFNTGFDTSFLKFWIITICCLTMGGFVGYKAEQATSGGWRAGLVIMAVIMFGASWYGFYPWVVSILFFVFVGGIFFYDSKK